MKSNLHNGTFFFLLLLWPFCNFFAQGTDQVNLKLAQEFIGNKEYDKAIGLLEDLYKKKQSADIYNPLFSSYLAQKMFEDAEKLAKKQSKNYPDDYDYQVDYGFALSAAGDRKKGEDVYRSAIKKIKPLPKDALDLSRSFQRRNENTFAIDALKQGKKLTGDTYGFEFELGELYYQQGNIEAMLEEYLGLIDRNDQYLQNVQNALNTSIYNDLNKSHLTLLNHALLKRVQRNPDRPVYAEMLMWHYLQQKDFKGALIQAKALDKRNNENGRRFLSLAAACRSNREYDLAMECYQYLIDLGPSSFYYINARILMTETIHEKITSSRYTKEDLLILEQNYLKTLEDLGRNNSLISLQTGLARLWAFYLDKKPAAAQLLEDVLKIHIAKPVDAARCKILLGDIYLSQGEIWEASLLYSQVEKDFKYEAIGDEAKFKNAKVYFYTGDFLWAKAQLDVLKGSTSKLISNDALRLSLTISDNIVLDSAGEALQMYARASFSVEQNNFAEALQILDTMNRIYLAHTIIDEVLLLKYNIFFKQQQYEKCVQPLTIITEQYKQDVTADEALFKLAELYDYFLNDKTKAQDLYKKLLTEYPSSIRVVAARNRYREMRGDSVN